MDFKTVNIDTEEEKMFLTLDDMNRYLAEQYSNEIKWLPSDFIIYQFDAKEWIWRDTK